MLQRLDDRLPGWPRYSPPSPAGRPTGRPARTEPAGSCSAPGAGEAGEPEAAADLALRPAGGRPPARGARADLALPAPGGAGAAGRLPGAGAAARDRARPRGARRAAAPAGAGGAPGGRRARPGGGDPAGRFRLALSPRRPGRAAGAAGAGRGARRPGLGGRRAPAARGRAGRAGGPRAGPAHGRGGPARPRSRRRSPRSPIRPAPAIRPAAWRRWWARSACGAGRRAGRSRRRPATWRRSPASTRRPRRWPGRRRWRGAGRSRSRRPPSRRCSSLALEAATLPSPGEPAAGAAELLGQDELGGAPVRAAILLGCADGGFPAAPPPEPLLREPERQAIDRHLRRPAVATAGARRAEALHRAFVSAAAGTELVAFAWPAPGPAGDGGPPSPLVVEALAAAGVSRAGGGAARAAPAGRPDRARRAAGRGPARAGRGARAGRDAARRPRRGRGWRAASWRRSGARRCWPGRPGRGPAASRGRRSRLLRAALPEEWTPSQLETHARCPFRAYLQLGLALPDQAAPDLDMEPRDEGTLLHALLERFVSGRLARGAWPPTGSAEDLAEARAAAEEVLARFEREGRTGDPATWAGRREAVLHRLDRMVAAPRRATTAGSPRACWSTPSAAGRRRRRSTLRAGGEKVRLRGRIDRVDASPERLLVDRLQERQGLRRPEGGARPGGLRDRELPGPRLPHGGGAGPARAEALGHLLAPAVGRAAPARGAPARRAAARRPGAGPDGFAAAVVERVGRMRAGRFPVVSQGCERCPFGAVCRYRGAGGPDGGGGVVSAVVFGPAAEALFRLTGPTAVSAGAGSGKTTALVELVLRLLDGRATGQPFPPVELAAITFTEKAGEELRARVRAAVAGQRARRRTRPGRPAAGRLAGAAPRARPARGRDHPRLLRADPARARARGRARPGVRGRRRGAGLGLAPGGGARGGGRGARPGRPVARALSAGRAAGRAGWPAWVAGLVRERSTRGDDGPRRWPRATPAAADGARRALAGRRRGAAGARAGLAAPPARRRWCEAVARAQEALQPEDLDGPLTAGALARLDALGEAARAKVGRGLPAGAGRGPRRAQGGGRAVPAPGGRRPGGAAAGGAGGAGGWRQSGDTPSRKRGGPSGRLRRPPAAEARELLRPATAPCGPSSAAASGAAGGRVPGREPGAAVDLRAALPGRAGGRSPARCWSRWAT